jgi:hypothetical protein
LSSLYRVVVPSAPVPEDSPYKSIAITKDEFPNDYTSMQQALELVVRQQLFMNQQMRDIRPLLRLPRTSIPMTKENKLLEEEAKKRRNQFRRVFFNPHNNLFSPGHNAAQERLVEALLFIHDVVYQGLKTGRQLMIPSLLILADHPRTIADIITKQDSPLETTEAPGQKDTSIALKGVLPADLSSDQATTTQHTGAPTHRETRGTMGREREKLRPTLKIPPRRTPPSES